jgi:hypothetical protein
VFPEYSIGMGSMPLSLGVLPSGDILRPPQQDKEYSLELAEHYQTCKCSAQALFCLFISVFLSSLSIKIHEREV